MRNIILSFFALALMVVSLPQQGHAADGVSIGLVDVEKILAESKAAKSLQEQIKAKREDMQKEFAAKEKELKKSEQSLIDDKSKLSAEEFGKKRKAYEEKVMDARNLFQKRRGSLDTGVNKAMIELRKAIVEATTAVAEPKGYQIVLTRDAVLIADKKLDITPEVLKKLDDIKTSIKLSVE